MTSPVSSGDLLFHRDFLEAVRAWISRDGHTPVGVLLVEQGQPGAGVSTLWTILETEFEQIAFVREADPGVGKRNVIGQRNVFLFDDMDSVISNTHTMKSIMDCIALRRVPVILSGYYRRGTKSKLRAALKKVPDVTTLAVPRIMGRVAIPYLEKLGRRDAERVWYESRGDLRQCLRSIDVGGVSTKLPDGIDALTELLGPSERSFADRARIASGDSTIITSGIFENYPKAVGPGGLETCCRILDCIGHVAHLESAMYDDPTRDFHPYIASLMGGVPGLGPLHLKTPIVTYGTQWAKHNHANAKRITERELTRSTGLGKQDLAYLRSMIFDANERRKSGKSAHVSSLEGLDAGDLWKCVTLFQPGAKRRKYTKVQHTNTFTSAEQ